MALLPPLTTAFEFIGGSTYRLQQLFHHLPCPFRCRGSSGRRRNCLPDSW